MRRVVAHLLFFERRALINNLISIDLSIYLQYVIVKPLNEVGHVTALADQLLVFRDVFRLSTANFVHVDFELLDLVYFPLPAIPRGDLNK